MLEFFVMRNLDVKVTLKSKAKTVNNYIIKNQSDIVKKLNLIENILPTKHFYFTCIKLFTIQ